MTFGLEAAELGEAFDVEPVGLIAGAIEGGLGVVRVFAFEKVGFDDTAAAKPPGGGHDFDSENLFDGTLGREMCAEGFGQGRVFGFFTSFDEVRGGEEAEGDGVGGGAGLAFGGAGSGGMPGVAAVGGELSFCGHKGPLG
jgi:hypothetical protein